MPLSRSDKYGREKVRALSDPHTGKVLTGALTSDGPNEHRSLSEASLPVEGVTVCMLENNTGTVYIIENGKEAPEDGAASRSASASRRPIRQ